MRPPLIPPPHCHFRLLRLLRLLQHIRDSTLPVSADLILKSFPHRGRRIKAQSMTNIVLSIVDTQASAFSQVLNHPTLAVIFKRVVILTAPSTTIPTTIRAEEAADRVLNPIPFPIPNYAILQLPLFRSHAHTMVT